ncbi:MAG: PHA/PHB synthase family protein, partial [Lautropia sp.]
MKSAKAAAGRAAPSRSARPATRSPAAGKAASKPSSAGTGKRAAAKLPAAAVPTAGKPPAAKPAARKPAAKRSVKQPARAAGAQRRAAATPAARSVAGAADVIADAAAAAAADATARAAASAAASAAACDSPMPWAALPAWQIDQQALAKLQGEYVDRVGDLLNRFAKGEPPGVTDRRFGGKAWQEQPQFGWQAAWYLLNADFMQRTAALIDSDKKTKDRIRFVTQQWVDAWSPANFLASNPEAQAKMVETGGESLRAGIGNLLGDLQHGRISQTDLTAFEVGRNVGTSPGAVVYENELIQLIQYAPQTATVGARPLLMVPPSINKFYILDLQPENSFIGHAVAQGNTVFVVSWRNVKEPQGHLTWDDYLQHGIVDSIDVVQRISGEKTINALGFCVGGTILCTALAALAAKGRRPVESLT